MCEAVPTNGCDSFPAVSVTPSSPTIRLFDWFYCPMHAVTVTMSRNDLLASHVTLTQEHAIPSYPLASLTTAKSKQVMHKSVIVNCQ